MKIQPKTLKGFRDFLPEEARKRSFVISVLKKVFESYGFEPLETPVLEYEEILLGKYGKEADKLMYRFKDLGGRNVAMRYDQTVPLARIVAQYANILPLPFKRYQISNVWRAENTQKGRFREFLQCDIDTVGVDSAFSDSEIINVVISSMESLGIKDFRIIINDRSIFKDIPKEAIIIIDKLKKIGEEKVFFELISKGFDSNVLKNIRTFKPTKRIEEVIEIINDKRVVFDPTLARGLDYYTGIIIEIEINGYSGGSVGGGGRYNELIGLFTGTPMPAVGFAFGFDRLMETLESFNLFRIDSGTTKVLVSVFSEDLEKDSINTANKLRSMGINTELWLEKGSKIEKQLKYANRKKIPYVLILGPEEVEKNMVTIKALETQDQKTLSLSDAIKIIS